MGWRVIRYELSVSRSFVKALYSAGSIRVYSCPFVVQMNCHGIACLDSRYYWRGLFFRQPPPPSLAPPRNQTPPPPPPRSSSMLAGTQHQPPARPPCTGLPLSTISQPPRC